MLKWLKSTMAHLLGNHKEKILKLPIIKNLNDLANKKIDGDRQLLLKENAHQILKEFEEMNRQLGHKIWIEAGTLLGYEREGAILAHDIDMDFAMMSPKDSNELETIIEFLSKRNFVLNRKLIYQNQVKEISFSYNGLNVAIILFDRVDDDVISTTMIWYGMNALNKPVNVEAFYYELPMEDLKEVTFMEAKTYAPTNAVDYLKAYYGEDYLIPNTNYDWRQNKIYVPVDGKEAKVELI